MLKIDIRKSVAFVVLDRPEVHNAFNDELARLVTEAFTELGRRNEAVLAHHVQNRVAASLRPLRITERIARVRRLNQAGQHSRFG